MADHVWKGAGYLADITAYTPIYQRLQDELAAAATVDLRPTRVLDLGTGTGETARRVLELHPDAQLIGVDDSADMLGHALHVLPHERVRLQVGRIEAELPPGPFDLVTSALCVHHLDGPAKAALFGRVHDVLAPGGRVVIGDLVVPPDPADVVTHIDWEYDLPSSAEEQLAWLREAGLAARVAGASATSRCSSATGRRPRRGPRRRGQPAASTSARVGSDGCAPWRVVASAAARTAQTVASSAPAPRARASARAPQRRRRRRRCRRASSGGAGSRAGGPARSPRALRAQRHDHGAGQLRRIARAIRNLASVAGSGRRAACRCRLGLVTTRTSTRRGAPRQGPPPGPR